MQVPHKTKAELASDPETPLQVLYPGKPSFQKTHAAERSTPHCLDSQGVDSRSDLPQRGGFIRCAMHVPGIISHTERRKACGLQQH